MNPLQRVLIEKTGHDNGFECVVEETLETVTLASARHHMQVIIEFQTNIQANQFNVALSNPSPTMVAELIRSFPEYPLDDSRFSLTGENKLAKLLRRISALAHSLPNQAVNYYDITVEKELTNLPINTRGTDVERMVRQRIGQQTYRQAMLDYWGSACAVTEISIPQVLRASHAKPWAECATDAERLDVFNGFLLSANLDALFDRFMISFTTEGKIMISPAISIEDQTRLGLNAAMYLRWLAPEHLSYLKYHQQQYEISK